tara:strand:+ start:78 stop:440 length:363 start_codon:yes stop_codon:yes gene_type:complete
MSKRQRIFSDLMDALKEMHEEVIVKKNMQYTYNGPDLTSNKILLTSPSISERLSPEGLDWEINHNVEKPIDVILTIALQLGIQQGIDLVTDNPIEYLDLDKVKMEEFNKAFEVLKELYSK